MAHEKLGHLSPKDPLPEQVQEEKLANSGPPGKPAVKTEEEQERFNH